MRPLFAALVSVLITSSMLASPGVAFGAGVDPSKATPVQREQAQSRFLKGKKFYDARNYAAAVDEFRASHDIVASPNSRLFLARSLRQKGDLVAAYTEFDRARVEAKELARDDSRYEKAGEAAAIERDALSSKLGFVIVEVEHPGSDTNLKIGGDTIRRAGWGEPAPVLPGTTAIEVETPGRPTATTSVTVSAGQTEHARLDAGTAPDADKSKALADVPPQGDSRTKMRTAAYVAGGVGAAGFLTFVVAGLMSNGTYGNLETACASGTCPAGVDDEISKGKTQQTIANIGLVFGLLGAGAGVTLFVLSQPKNTPAAPAAASAASDTRTRIVFGSSGAFLRGSF